MRRQLLWMAGLYVASVAALGVFALLMHLLMSAAGLTG